MSWHLRADGAFRGLHDATSLRRSLAAALVCALTAVTLTAAMLIASAPAGADVFGPISLLSASPLQQAEYAHDPAISGDGRYVVFDGSIGGVTGVWRRELIVGEDDQVVGGKLEQVAGGDAEIPSISENGQYVSFTTNEGAYLPQVTDGLAQPESNPREAPNVYVRDMSVAPGEAGAFKLASAVNGSTQGLSYEYAAGEAGKLEATRYGSTAAGRTALSANGLEVAFVTTAHSNLAGPGTPPLQVAVRNLETDETRLVSVEYDPATGQPQMNPETGQPEPVPEQVEEGSALSLIHI